MDVRGLAFRVWRSARPRGSRLPSFVLVHGIGVSHRYLSRLHRTLAAVGEVISIDLLGFGGLPKPDRDVDIPEMASALGEVLAALETGPVALVGHSMGAQWAIETAVQRPDDVRLVVAIGPVADERHRTVWAQARALGVDTLGEPPSVNVLVLTDYVRCGTRWYLTQVRHMLSYPTEDRAAALRMPLLVMRGVADPVSGREWCRRLRDRAPRSRFVEVPRGHHVVQQSAPRAVADAILFHLTDAGYRAFGQGGRSDSEGVA